MEACCWRAMGALLREMMNRVVTLQRSWQKVDNEGSETLEETCVTEIGGGPSPDARVDQLVGDTADQEERQSDLMEPVCKTFQDEATKNGGWSWA